MQIILFTNLLATDRLNKTTIEQSMFGMLDRLPLVDVIQDKPYCLFF